jgi:hypothetical protein
MPAIALAALFAVFFWVTYSTDDRQRPNRKVVPMPILPFVTRMRIISLSPVLKTSGSVFVVPNKLRHRRCR